MRLSVVIITFNEEKNIGRCIDSVLNVADEIIVAVNQYARVLVRQSALQAVHCNIWKAEIYCAFDMQHFVLLAALSNQAGIRR